MRNVLPVLLILLFAGSSPVWAQSVVVGFDEPVNQPSTLSVAAGNGDLYSIYMKPSIGFRNAILKVRKWNGLFWTDLPELNVTDFVIGPGNQMSALMYEGQLYIFGSFQMTTGPGAIKWTGTQWEVVAGGIRSTFQIHEEISVADAVSFNDELFVCGEFDWAGGTEVKNLIRLNQSGWFNIDYKGGAVTDLEKVGDTLFVAGDLTQIEGISIDKIAAYSQGVWKQVEHPFTTGSVRLTKTNNKLVAVTSTGLWLYDNGTWSSFGASFDVLELHDAVELNGVLYLSGTFTVNSELVRLIKFEKGYLKVILRDEDIDWVGGENISIETSGDFLYLMGGFSGLTGRKMSYGGLIKPGYSVITGNVFYDHNNNCKYDNGDEQSSGALLSLNEGEYYVSTRKDGSYEFFVPANSTNSLELYTQLGEKLTCGSRSRTIQASATDQQYTEDFAVGLDPQAAEVELTLAGETGFKVKHGYNGHYKLSVKCKDKSKFPLTLTLTRDERLKSYTTSLVPGESSMRKMTWVLNENGTIDLSFKIDHTTVNMGDTLLFFATVEAQEKSRTLQQEVVSAFDPNDKQCDKSEITPDEKMLNYHVRFQNMGTDNARNIHIVDTIDRQLPIEFIQILDNSHYDRYSSDYKVRGHAIVWSFEDIELPPKATAGDVGSSGYVTFECGLTKNLKVGQQIENKAHIYFDYQPPVITNTTHSEVVEGDTVPVEIPEGFRLYPNPVTDMFRVESGLLSVGKCEVYGVNGVLLYEHSYAKPVRTFDVPVLHWSEGIYYIRLHHNLGVEVIPFLVDRGR